ncbi:cell wall-binding repeat-containing protein [Finegoldia magna]|uniref:cell wall-binding repeat-containing protein n=4 Tax=Finegoldia magna TaxID=1260 RepID=UPI001D137B45|nr:cell wall-binding repeat-containing protein [Finegoldia magna]MCC3309868.1 cell wall-binding repeat-containing protein [Finegoldia magna]
MKKFSKLIKVILAFALIIGAFSFNSSFASAQDVEINETNFPDAKFREYVKEFDENRDEKLSQEEIKSVTRIDTSVNSPKNFKGIEYFTEIKSFYTSDNAENIDLSKNTKLEKIYCVLNQNLNELDLSKNTELKELDLSNNALTKLDLSNNSKLEEVNLWQNKIKEINLNNCVNLKKLNLTYNKLKELDLSDCVNLKNLDCENNNLETIDISKNKQLQSINARSNKLQAIDTTKNRELSSFIVDLQTFDYYTDIDHKVIYLEKLPGNPNPKRIKELENGKLVGNKIVLDRGKESVRYSYESRPGEIQRQFGDLLRIQINVKTGFTEEETQPAEENRISGRNRISTAIEVSKKYYEKANTVIIARSDEYPDSLTASPLAKKLNAPILLTSKNELEEPVKAEIKRLKTTNIIIVGGVNSISTKVEKELRQYDKEIERIAGHSRYETSAAIAERLLKLSKKQTAIIASGENFADALTAGAYAAKQEYPILLVQKTTVDTQITKVLNKYINKTIIAGGVNSVSEKVKKDLPKNTERIAGRSRYDTAAQIAKKLFKSEKAFVASGEVFADALVVSPVAGRLSSPILLVNRKESPETIKEYVKEKITEITVIGGKKFVPSSIVTDLEAAIK